MDHCANKGLVVVTAAGPNPSPSMRWCDASSSWERGSDESGSEMEIGGSSGSETEIVTIRSDN